MSDWYDKDGNPITIEEFGPLYEQEDYVRVGLTEIGPYVVSTVWLGIDYSFGHGPPIIFETLVFTKSAWEADRSEKDHKMLLELDGQRYSTEHEARRGHEDLCTLIRATYVESPSEQPSEGQM